MLLVLLLLTYSLSVLWSSEWFSIMKYLFFCNNFLSVLVKIVFSAMSILNCLFRKVSTSNCFSIRERALLKSFAFLSRRHNLGSLKFVSLWSNLLSLLLYFPCLWSLVDESRTSKILDTRKDCKKEPRKNVKPLTMIFPLSRRMAYNPPISPKKSRKLYIDLECDFVSIDM